MVPPFKSDWDPDDYARMRMPMTDVDADLAPGQLVQLLCRPFLELPRMSRWETLLLRLDVLLPWGQLDANR